MKTILNYWWSGSISLFCLLMSGCASGPVDVSEQIKLANSEFMTAVSSGDVSNLTSMYTADAKLFPANNEIVDGQSAIGQFWEGTLQMGIKKVMFETETATSFGEIVIEEGKYSLFVEGDLMVDQGKYIVNWKNENGKWKVYRDIWNASTPVEKQKAAANDTVFIVTNIIKPEKLTQFEDFYNNYLIPAGKEFSPEVKKTVRTLKPAYKNQDGTFTYLFLIDPYVGSFNYDILYTLSLKFGEEKAREYLKMYTDCLKDGKSQGLFLVESGL